MVYQVAMFQQLRPPKQCTRGKHHNVPVTSYWAFNDSISGLRDEKGTLEVVICLQPAGPSRQSSQGSTGTSPRLLSRHGEVKFGGSSFVWRWNSRLRFSWLEASVWEVVSALRGRFAVGKAVGFLCTWSGWLKAFGTTVAKPIIQMERQVPRSISREL